MPMQMWTRLQQLHQRLEAKLAAERRRSLPDTIRIARIKKIKLAVKDRLTLSGQPLLA